MSYSVKATGLGSSGKQVVGSRLAMEIVDYKLIGGSIYLYCKLNQN